MSNNNRKRAKTTSKTVSLMAMLFVLAMVLSFVENIFTAGLQLPLGIKPGLSNIITMYCLFFLGKKYAYSLTFLKSMFVFLTRGGTASALSLAGGLFSITLMVMLSMPRKLNLSYTVLSIAGAVGHNMAQIVIASFILGLSQQVSVGLIPLLLITGIGMGVVTGFVLKLVYPALERLNINPEIE